MNYEDKILVYLNKLGYDAKIEISKIAEFPETFIAAVKILMNENLIPEIEFSNDYQYIKKICMPLNYKHSNIYNRGIYDNK